MNIDMRPIRNAAIGVLVIIGGSLIFFGGMGTMAFISGPCECTEITSTAGKIQPNLTIKCYDLELTKCDTTYTYKARW